MEKNNLKLLWKEINAEKSFDNDKNIDEIIRMGHCKTITEILNNQKLKCLIYVCFFLIFLGLMFYAFGYLGLHLSFNSIAPLVLTGFFLFIKTIIECSRLWILVSRSDEYSLKESTLLFRKKLERIKMVDFFSSLIYCYGWIIAIISIFICDHKGLRDMSVLIVILILLLLSIPWLIKYQHSRRYNNIYNNLKQSTDYFNNHL